MFSRYITEILKCVPCLASKIKQSPIDEVDPYKTMPHTEFYLKLSGPIKQSVGGNFHVTYFIKTTSSITDVCLLKSRCETSSEVKNCIAKFDGMG